MRPPVKLYGILKYSDLFDFIQFKSIEQSPKNLNPKATPLKNLKIALTTIKQHEAGFSSAPPNKVRPSLKSYLEVAPVRQ